MMDNRTLRQSAAGVDHVQIEPTGRPQKRAYKPATAERFFEAWANWFQKKGARFVVLFLLFTLMSGYLGTKSAFVRMDEAQEALRQENAKLLARQAEMQAEIDRLKSPAVVAEAARKMGMANPNEPPQLVVYVPQLVIKEAPPPKVEVDPTAANVWNAGITLFKTKVTKQWNDFWSWVDRHTPSL